MSLGVVKLVTITESYVTYSIDELSTGRSYSYSEPNQIVKFVPKDVVEFDILPSMHLVNLRKKALTCTK